MVLRESCVPLDTTALLVHLMKFHALLVHTEEPLMAQEQVLKMTALRALEVSSVVKEVYLRH